MKVNQSVMNFKDKSSLDTYIALTPVSDFVKYRCITIIKNFEVIGKCVYCTEKNKTKGKKQDAL